MKNKYTQKQEDKVIEKYCCGEKGSNISKETGIPKTTIYGWIRNYESNIPKHNKAINLKKYHELETKYLRQQKAIDVLHHSPCVVNSPLDERIATIEEMVSNEYTMDLPCYVLCVSKGTYYN